MVNAQVGGLRKAMWSFDDSSSMAQVRAKHAAAKIMKDLRVYKKFEELDTRVAGKLSQRCSSAGIRFLGRLQSLRIQIME